MCSHLYSELCQQTILNTLIVRSVNHVFSYTVASTHNIVASMHCELHLLTKAKRTFKSRNKTKQTNRIVNQTLIDVTISPSALSHQNENLVIGNVLIKKCHFAPIFRVQSAWKQKPTEKLGSHTNHNKLIPEQIDLIDFSS